MNARVLPSLLRALIPALALLSTARAGQVVMDFGNYNPASQLLTVVSPVTEDGLRLTNPNNFYMFGPGSARNTGHKALSPQFTNTTNTLTAVSGAPFTLVSMLLSPFNAGSNSTVNFTGNVSGGGTVTASFSTGTSIGGVVRIFPATFTNLTSVTWTMDGSGTQYHQFDDITAILKPEVTLHSPAITVTESSGSVTVGVSLSEAMPSALNVAYTIANGTAVSGTDFTGAASGTLTIPAGQRSATLTISITNDTTVESLENFTVTFSAGSGAAALAVFPSGPAAVTTVNIASEDGVTGFPGWMTAHGLTAATANPDADPNSDGVSNIESWLLKINPAGPSPQTWLDRRAAFLFDGSNRPALRFTVPAPFPSDVQIIFEETVTLNPWSEQARRTGWGTGSLWTGTGSTRVAESTSVTAKTVTCSGSQNRTQRPKAYLRMKYAYISGGGAT